MKIRKYNSDWSDNGMFIECKKCGASSFEECKCFEVIEIKKCHSCGAERFELDNEVVYCKKCNTLMGIKCKSEDY